MATRLKDGEVPYTGGIGIEITNNHVINVLLRELNNLIHVNENRELYVDLQLDDGIQPEDDFPVGITTGRILQEDGWQQNGLIINRKTTSGDYTRLITAADGNLYVDLGDGVWRLLGGEGGTCDCNVKRFVVSSTTDSTTGQAVLDWYNSGKYPILVYGGTTYLMSSNGGSGPLRFDSTRTGLVNHMNEGYSQVTRAQLWLYEDENHDFSQWEYINATLTPGSIYVGLNYQTPYAPQTPGDPVSKQYVDDGLALKQDKLTAGNYITIDQNNVISALLPSALVYKGNVNGIADLPSSATVGDTYFVEGADAMYSWDGTQWNYVGGTGISLTDYFNKTVDDSDDITEGSVHLFCTSTEKNTWNNKQDQLTAGTNITIDSNNVISAVDTTYSGGDGISINGTVINNTAKFDPENSGSLGQFLKKTSTGYAWANIPGGGGGGGGGGTSYTAGSGISISNSNVISNTAQFDPTNSGTVGQVLKKGSGDTYYWASEGSIGDCNVKCFDIPSFAGATQSDIKAVTDWVDADTDNGAIIRTNTQDVFLYSFKTVVGSTTTYKFFSYRNRTTPTNSANGDFTSLKQIACSITYDGTTYTIADEDFNTVTNFLVVENSSYTTPYMPTASYQPATKAYVDAVAAGSVQVQAITNNTTGTNLTLQQEWVGTQAQYDLITPINGVIYNIIPS